MVHTIAPTTIKFGIKQIRNRTTLKKYLEAVLGNTSRKIKDEEIIKMTSDVLEGFKKRRFSHGS